MLTKPPNVKHLELVEAHHESLTLGLQSHHGIQPVYRAYPAEEDPGNRRYTVIPLSAGEAGPGKGRPPAVPWGRMLRSNAVWAIIINNFTFHYAFYVVMNWLPTYFDQVPPFLDGGGTRSTWVASSSLNRDSGSSIKSKSIQHPLTSEFLVNKL